MLSIAIGTFCFSVSLSYMMIWCCLELGINFDHIYQKVRFDALCPFSTILHAVVILCSCFPVAFGGMCSNLPLGICLVLLPLTLLFTYITHFVVCSALFRWFCFTVDICIKSR